MCTSCCRKPFLQEYVSLAKQAVSSLLSLLLLVLLSRSL